MPRARGGEAVLRLAGQRAGPRASDEPRRGDAASDSRARRASGRRGAPAVRLGVRGRDRPRERGAAGLDRARAALEQHRGGLVLRRIGGEVVRDPQLPADALVAAQQALHGRQARGDAVEVARRARPRDRARARCAAARCRAATRARCASCSKMREQRVDRRRLDLVARAAHEVQRLGRDVAIRACDRRRRDGRLGEVLHERDAEREHGTGGMRVAILRGRHERGPPLLRERVGGGERVVVGAREPREDRAGASSAIAGSAAISSLIHRGSSAIGLRSPSARRTTGVSMPGTKSARSRAAICASVVAPRSSRRSITRSHSAAWRVAASAQHAVDLGLEPALAAAQLRRSGSDRSRRRACRARISARAAASRALPSPSRPVPSRPAQWWYAISAWSSRPTASSESIMIMRVFVVGDAAAREARRSRAPDRRDGSPPTRTRARAGRRRSSSARCA